MTKPRKFKKEKFNPEKSFLHAKVIQVEMAEMAIDEQRRINSNFLFFFFFFFFFLGGGI